MGHPLLRGPLVAGGTKLRLKPSGGSPPWGGASRRSDEEAWLYLSELEVGSPGANLGGPVCERSADPDKGGSTVSVGGDLGAVLLRASGRAPSCCLCASVSVCPASGRSSGRLHPRCSWRQQIGLFRTAWLETMAEGCSFSF